MEKNVHIEELHALVCENPSAALARLHEPGNRHEEVFASAAILIDGDGHLGDFEAVNKGVEILKGLHKIAESDPGLYYNVVR